MSGIYQLHCQRHLINVLTWYSCPHTTCITAEPLDVMVNTAQYILNVLGWRCRGIKHEGLNLNKNTWYKHFPLKKSTNKPPNKEVYCIMWTLIETLLILLNYTPACTYSLHAPRLYCIRHFLLLFLIQCSTVWFWVNYCISFYTIRVKEKQEKKKTRHRTTFQPNSD